MVFYILTLVLLLNLSLHIVRAASDLYITKNDASSRHDDNSSSPNFRDPRTEIIQNSTSGEHTWLAKTKKQTVDVVSNEDGVDNDSYVFDYNHNDYDSKDKKQGHVENIHNHSPSLLSKKQYHDHMRKTKTRGEEKANNSTTTLSSSKPHHFSKPVTKDYLNDYDGAIEEFHPLANPHGLNPETNIDRSTIARLQNAAQDGSTDSAYFLGIIHIYGLHQNISDTGKKRSTDQRQSNKKKDMLPRDSNMDELQAMKWLEQAAAKGHIESQCALGLLLYHGLGSMGKDRKTAMRWFYRASVDSYIDYNIKRKYSINGRIGDDNIIGKREYAYWLLGRTLYEGLKLQDIGVKTLSALDFDEHTYSDDEADDSNLIQAAFLFENINGIPEAMHQLALLFEYGLIPNDFCSIAKASNPHMRQERKGKKEIYHAPNFERATILYRTAADLGSTESLYNLALMYTYGRGVPLNYAKAKDLFRQAALHKKHSPSMRYLGLLAVKGYGQPHDSPNPEEAMYWLGQCVEERHRWMKHWRSAPLERKGFDKSNFDDSCEEELMELKNVMDSAKIHRFVILTNFTTSTMKKEK